MSKKRRENSPGGARLVNPEVINHILELRNRPRRVLLNIRAKPRMLLQGHELSNCQECNRPCSFPHMVMSCPALNALSHELQTRVRHIVGHGYWDELPLQERIFCLLGSDPNVKGHALRQLLLLTATFIEGTLPTRSRKTQANFQWIQSLYGLNKSS